MQAWVWNDIFVGEDLPRFGGRPLPRPLPLPLPRDPGGLPLLPSLFLPPAVGDPPSDMGEPGWASASARSAWAFMLGSGTLAKASPARRSASLSIVGSHSYQLTMQVCREHSSASNRGSSGCWSSAAIVFLGLGLTRLQSLERINLLVTTFWNKGHLEAIIQLWGFKELCMKINFGAWNI